MTIIASRNWHGLRELVEEFEKEANLLKQEAGELYTIIDSKIGKGPNGLYRTGINDDRECTDSNAAMGIFACLLGNERQGEELYRLIKKKIGKNRSAVDDGMSPPYLHDAAIGWGGEYTSDNAGMGILACLVGRKAEAEELYASIKDKIGKGANGLYRMDIHGWEDTESNAFMGVPACLLGRRGEAEEQYRLIDEKIGKEETGLYKLAWGTADNACLYSYPNAAMGILAFLLDRKDEARELYKSINGKIGKMQSGLFCNSVDKDSGAYVDGEHTDANAAIGILVCLLAGAEMKPR